MNQNIDFFMSCLGEYNIKLTDKQIQQFIEYYRLLMEWNSFLNLTTIKEFNEVVIKHFIDSLSPVLLNQFHLKDRLKVIDVGTGAGFPGIPLKIAFPELDMQLLDSLNKRVDFLNCVIEKLNLSGIYTIHGRAENYAKQELYREKFDLCVSRAVADLKVLAEYCIPFIKEKGHFISFKSYLAELEVEEALPAINILGGKIVDKKIFCLPFSDIHRRLICICKENKTPDKYPRREGLPTKKPIK